MKRKLKRFFLDPYYPGPAERVAFRKALASSFLVVFSIGGVVLFFLGPVVGLLFAAVAQGEATKLVPIVVSSPKEASAVVHFHSAMVSWRWILLLLSLPVLWIAARGYSLLARVFSAVFLSFLYSVILFESIKSNDRLTQVYSNWHEVLPPDSLDELCGMVFWFTGWNIGLGTLLMGVMCSLTAALISEKRQPSQMARPTNF